MVKKFLGKVIHYFPKPKVAIIQTKNEIKLNNIVSIYGPKTKIKQKIESIKICKESIKNDKIISIKVKGKVNINDYIYLENE